MSKFNDTELYIMNNYKIKTQNMIGLELGISRNKVNSICRKLGLRKIKLKYTLEKDEIIKPIKELNNLYGVTQYGKIINLITNTTIKPKISKDGYYVITTQQNYIRKQLLLHRIIALYFIEWYSKTNNVVNHKDGNKLNNKLDNLEWCSVEYNNKHFWNNGKGLCGSQCSNSTIDETIALNIFNDYHINRLSQRECQIKYNTTRSIVQKIIYKQRWKHIHNVD